MKPVKNQNDRVHMFWDTNFAFMLSNAILLRRIVQIIVNPAWVCCFVLGQSIHNISIESRQDFWVIFPNQ